VTRLGTKRYAFRIPYPAFGGASGQYLKAYALYGESNATGMGIHSAAPVPAQAQTDLMDLASGHGLARLTTAPPTMSLPLVCEPAVVISAVYGGGGGSVAGATYTQDYVELHNRMRTPFTIPSGWSIQYASATGTFGSSSSQIHVLPSITIPPSGYVLIAEGTQGTTGVALPTPDASGPIMLSAANGKVALASISTSVGACGALVPGAVVDLMGYGTTNIATCEGAATPALGASTAAARNAGGCADTNDSSADFSVSTPAPRNAASPAGDCAGSCP
jgi:hypothetical protein